MLIIPLLSVVTGVRYTSVTSWDHFVSTKLPVFLLKFTRLVVCSETAMRFKEGQVCDLYKTGLLNLL